MTSDVSIQKVPDATKSVWSLFDEGSNLVEDLQRRAYSLFQARNGHGGGPLDDWIRAEQERFEIPRSELTENKDSIHLEAQVPGLAAKNLAITVTPCELVIRGERSSRRQNKEKGEIRFSEFSEKKFFRRIALPSQVDVDRTKANLDDGILTIDMPKVHGRKSKRVSVSEKAARA